VARYIDNNNLEGGDPIAYLGTSIIAKDAGVTGRFLDKPWFAVDVPRFGARTCHIVTPGAHGPVTQDIPAGVTYAAFSAITGEGATLASEILFSSSTDCGRTWSPAVRISRRQDQINQGASIAIDPGTGDVYVAWRRFSVSAPTTATPSWWRGRQRSDGSSTNRARRTGFRAVGGSAGSSSGSSSTGGRSGPSKRST